MAGRRTSLATLAAGKVEDVPGKEEPTLVRLPIASVVPTPLNPRKDFGSREELVELGESMKRNQLGPIVVVSRASYLKLFPEHTDRVGQVAYIIANGERRFRGATAAGLPTIEAVIREAISLDRKTFIDAVVTENVDRKNFDPIEEAYAVDMMVAEFGTARAVAEHRGVTEGWVSQRRSLTRLGPDMQHLVRKRIMPVDKARQLAKAIKDRALDDEQQREWWEAELGRPKAAQQKAVVAQVPPAASLVEQSARSQIFTAVKTAENQPGGETTEKAGAAGSEVGREAESLREAQDFTAVKIPAAETAATAQDATPASHEATATSSAATPAAVAVSAAPVVMPWSSPERVLAILREHMTGEDFRLLVKLAQA